jgi:S-DNA-T family DNA segregation ATPase FtsK/SpoIIIE
MRKIVTGEQIAQLTNPDPFAVPAWRAPVYRTPGWIITLVQLVRFLVWLARLIVRHPVAATVVAVLVLAWLNVGWLGLAFLFAWAVVVLTAWRFFWPCPCRCPGSGRNPHTEWPSGPRTPPR